ncbi:MAG TPA: VOC family protein [Longimicrobiales bacterium]
MSGLQSGLSRRRSDPESFRARGLSVSMSVQDLDASVDWYCHAIGFVVDRTYEREGVTTGVALKAGNVRLLLNQDDGARGRDRVKGVGMSLFFTTVQDVDALAERIKAEGSTLEMEPSDTPWGTRAFRVRDPDGFMLVISSEAAV